MNSKKIISSSFLYLFASIFGQLINMLLIPIYTRNLSVSQFGQYNLVNSVQNLFAIFITAGVISGFCRFVNEYEDKNILKNTILVFSAIWGIILIVLFAIIGPYISKYIFGNDPLATKYIIYIVTISVVTCLISVYSSYFSMDFKAGRVSAIEMSKIIIAFVNTYIFLSVLKTGIIGVLRAQLLAYSLVLLTLILFDIKNLATRPDKKMLHKILSYGTAMIPGQVSSWILTLADRYFIKGMIGLSAVGIYSMGYKLGMLIEPLFLSPFRTVFTAFKFAVYKDSDGKERIKTLYNYFNFFGWFIILSLGIFSDIAIRILSTSEYNTAYIVVPIIAFSYFLWGLGEFYALGLHVASKMLTNSCIVIISAVANCALNLLLIPYMGISGAALATVISYFIANILYYFSGKKYYDIGISLLEPYKYSLVFLVLYFAYVSIKMLSFNFVIEILINIVILCLYVVICILLKFTAWEKMKSFILEIKGTFSKQKQ